MKYIAKIGDQEYKIEILSETRVLINGTSHEIDFKPLRQHLSYSLLADGRSYEVNIYRDNGDWEVLLRGRQFSVEVEDERERRLRLAAGQTTLPKGKYLLKAPMPGLVIDIPVSEGDQVSKGDVLVILESMKMQNELTAPRDGTVTRVHANENDNVDRNEILLVLE
jgi:biotin carboxyl carrier protein